MCEHTLSPPAITNTRENGGEHDVGTSLKLSKDVREKLAALEALSEKAENGDKEARRALRRAVRESSPRLRTSASVAGGH